VVSPATTTDYAITCTGPDGSKTATTTIVVNPVINPVNHPPVITLIGANPFEMIVNTVFTDPGATAFDQEDGNLTAQIVSTSTVNANVVGTYTISYFVKDSSNLSATTSRTVIVKPFVCTVNCGGGSNLPTVSLTANPAVITLGATSTLNWNSSNTTSCSALWTNATSTSGSKVVSPATTTDYAITCTGPDGSKTATTTIVVNPVINPVSPSVTISANPQTITVGGSTVVSWISNNTTSCSALWTNANSTCATAFFKSDLKEFRFLEGLNLGGEDSLWLWELIKSDKIIKQIDKVLYYYRSHNDRIGVIKRKEEFRELKDKEGLIIYKHLNKDNTNESDK
jgi:hypothetical protein